ERLPDPQTKLQRALFRGGPDGRQGLNEPLWIETETSTAIGGLQVVIQAGDDGHVARHNVTVNGQVIATAHVVGIGPKLARRNQSWGSEAAQEVQHPVRLIKRALY